MPSIGPLPSVQQDPHPLVTRATARFNKPSSSDDSGNPLRGPAKTFFSGDRFGDLVELTVPTVMMAAQQLTGAPLVDVPHQMQTVHTSQNPAEEQLDLSDGLLREPTTKPSQGGNFPAEEPTGSEPPPAAIPPGITQAEYEPIATSYVDGSLGNAYDTLDGRLKNTPAIGQLMSRFA